MALSAGQIMEYGEIQALKGAFGMSTTTATTLWLALLTAAPAAGTDATMASETEYGATSYARASLTTSSAWTGPSAASPSLIENSGTISYGPFTGGTGATITWAMLTDTASTTAGHCIVAYPLANSRTPLVGDSLSAAANAFTCTV